MRICGIVCEYNPFHNGHLYQIEMLKHELNFDAVVCIMSGNWVQRGSVAIFDKSTRAEAAVLCGADLVLELPAIYSMQTAEVFSKNSIYILNSLGLINSVAFGTECEDINALNDIAELLAFETDDFKTIIQDNLKLGLPYHTARNSAVDAILGDKYSDVLQKPNNILGIEYIKAIKRQNSSILPIAIKRNSTEHNDTSISNEKYASATAIRNAINSKKSNFALQNLVPEKCLELYNQAKRHDIEVISKAVLYNILKTDVIKIANTPDISEGLENKIKKSAANAKSFAELCDMVKSKRYAHSRIRRIILNSFLGITKDEILSLPQYIKILDFSEIGRQILHDAKKTTALPLAKNRNGIKGIKNAEKLWDRELIFDKIYDLSEY